MSKLLETELIRNTAIDLGIGMASCLSDIDWKSRTIYCMAGRIGLCSLWDKLEEGSVSIVHFKKAVERELTHLLRVYAECMPEFPGDVSILSEEFLNIYIKCGYIYHSPFNIHPSIHKRVTVGNIEFLRGAYIDLPCKMSGLGLYRVVKANDSNYENVISALELFHLCQTNIIDYGNSIIETAIWKEFSYTGRIEYLKTKGAFKSGYWCQEPDSDGRVSLLRAGERGQQIYYLYYYEGNKCYTSTLDPWRVENGEYRRIAIFIISRDHDLMNIEYHKNGSVVEIRQNYLLPPDELSFIKLYSWPIFMKNGTDDFNRIMSKEVFISIKTILENTGYKFKEV